MRVALARLTAPLSNLPTDEREWVDALPAESRSHVFRSAVPRGRIDWVRTRQLGWPPDAFVMRQRTRQADSVLATALAWAVGRAVELLDAAPALLTSDELAAVSRLQVLAELAEQPLLSSATPREPRGDDLKALAASGHPWRELGTALNAYLALEERGLANLALDLLAPDPELGGKLFHLAVCGEVLYALAELGARIESIRPIGDARGKPRPAFAATLGAARWQLWFESSGIWSDAGVEQPYKRAIAAVRGRPQALSADLLLINRADRRALFLECKDSEDATYVGRGGYHQATTYLVEAQGRLSDETVALTVGHRGAVDGLSTDSLAGGTIGLVEADGVADVVTNFVQGAKLP